mgnify:CR=1
MNNKQKEKESSTLDFETDNKLNNYILLVRKLKSIKQNIIALEKNFLEK